MSWLLLLLTHVARDFGDQVPFRELAYAFVDPSAPKTRYLSYQLHGDNFMVLAAHFDGGERAELIPRQVS